MMTKAWRERPQSIEIPVRESNEVVEVFLDELPNDPSEIRAILYAEGAPIELFLHFAIEYYYQGKFEEFRYLIKEGLAECRRRGERKSEVTLHTALAAFHIALGLHLLPTDRPEATLFEEATVNLNDAERNGASEVCLLLRKGLLLLAQRKLTQAEYTLKTVLNREPENVAAHVALGCAAFLGGDFKGSLYEFQTVLKQLPSSPEEMRLAIGQSHLRLGNDQAAQMAFERVLQSNPKSIAALVSLAVLFINRGASSLAQGLQLLKQAYDLDRQNPTVLFHLSNHFFFKKDYIKSLSLAQSALSNAGADDVKRAEALYMIGKIHHVQGNFEESFLYYSEAAKLHPNLVLAQLGLGQICLHKGDLTSAADCFERVVELERTAGHTINDADFWAMMGTATLSDPNRSGAEKLLKKAVALGGRSFDLFLAMAMLFEGRDPVEATNAYRQAAQIDAARFNSDPELLNNYAVVLHLTGALEEAYQVLANIAKLPLGPEMIAVCRFNEARLLEDMGRLSDAESIYKELVATNPNDVALYLRLGIICARRSQHGEAAEHYKEAIGLDDTNTAAWLLLAGNHLRVKAVTPARKAYERILKANDRHDQFALTALGNIYVEIARHERNPTTVRENLRRALEFFIKALQVQCQNYVAANGVGVVLAELGRFKDAKEVFLQVRQTAPKFTDATLNLAHCFVEMGQHGAAVNAYESLEDGKVGVLLFLARAYYIHAKAERDPAAFKVAIGYLERAAQILPNDAPIKFNIGLCQQEVAAAMLKRTADLGEDGDKAMMLVEAAHRTFTELSELESKPEAVDMKIVAQRLKYCNTLVASLKSRLETLKVTSNDRQVKLDAVRIQREEQLEAERERKRRDEEARRMEQARNEEIRKELAAKLRVTEERVKAADAVGDEVSEDERPVKRKRHGERRKLENVEDVGDEEEHVSRGRRSHLSKDIISSSDEEKE